MKFVIFRDVLINFALHRSVLSLCNVEALDHTLWKTRFGRGYGPSRKAENRMNEYYYFQSHVTH